MVLADVRDVAIILLAAISIAIGILLAILLVQIQSLIRLLQEEVKPILTSLQETAGTVRGTTGVVSEYVVTPVARLASVMAGVRRGLDVLRGRAPEEPEF